MQKSFTQANQANTPAIVTSAGTALADAGPINRSGWSIQNLGTNPLFVLLGVGASTTVFHQILKAGTGADDGSGGIMTQTDGTIYQGAITVDGTSPRFVVLEMK